MSDKNTRPEGSAKESKKNDKWEKGHEGPGQKGTDAGKDNNSEDQIKAWQSVRQKGLF